MPESSWTAPLGALDRAGVTMGGVRTLVRAPHDHVGPSAPDTDNTDDPSSWGMLVSQSNNGRSSTYERFNQDGSKTVTHVFWTVEAAAACASCDHRYQGGH